MNFNKLTKELTELVAVNAHIDAYVMACEWLHDKNPSLMEQTRHIMLSIRGEHERMGYLDEYQSMKRHNAYRIMMSQAKDILTEEEHKQFHDCF